MNRLRLTLIVALFCIPAVASALTATSTPTPAPFCTPPLCASGSVYHCPGECPGGCGVVCATPTPNCLPPADQIRFEFSADPLRPKLGESVRISVTATNTSNRIAGLPQMTLLGASAHFDHDPPPVRQSGPLGTFEASFELIAQRVGIAELTAFLTYETQLGCPPDLFFGFWQATSPPFQVIIEGDGGPTASPTPTPTPRPFCTPVSCPMGQVPYCPDNFLCECATACATPTPTAACTPVFCGPDAVPLCADGTTTCCDARCATRTPTPTPVVGGIACTGDCDRDGRVDVGEIIRGVRVALGLDDGCSDEFDRNLDGEVTVDEIVLAVNAALVGCLIE